jgi:dihydrolipoamide dehydrogenase
MQSPRLALYLVSVLSVDHKITADFDQGPFWACVPSKVLLRSPEVLQSAKTIRGAKERLNGNEKVDTKSLFERRDQITSGWDDTKALVPLIQRTGVQMVRGFGSIAGEKLVKVTPHQGTPVELQARLAVVLSTGSSPTLPEIPGLKEADPWQPRDATSSTVVPKHLIIMGGGVAGAECATAYSSYGSKVTVICSSSEILPRVDPEAGKIVRQALEAKGVTFYCSADVKKVDRISPDKLVVELATGDRLEGTELLVTAGRKANLEGLGLENIGVQVEARFLPVDEHLRVRGVNGKWLYAAGDLNGRALMTHISKYHAAVAANAILADSKGERDEDTAYSATSATADHQAVPQVIFTDPVRICR